MKDTSEDAFILKKLTIRKILAHNLQQSLTEPKFILTFDKVCNLDGPFNELELFHMFVSDLRNKCSLFLSNSKVH